MSKKSITLLMFFVLFGATGAMYSQPISFPLHIGDRWDYQATGTSILSRARIQRDTLMPNGERYVIFDSIPDYAWPLNFKYLRHASDSVWHYNPATQSGELLYRLDASPNDTLIKVSVENRAWAIVFHFQRTVTLFGAQRKQWTFGIYPTDVIDGGQSRTITDSLGLTEVGEHNGASVLQGALIDGSVFGNISSIPRQIQIPGQATLQQNFPNPFNPSTTIRYGLPNRSHVTLTVFNTLGQQVAQLVDGEMDVGYHEVKFDGTNLASGVYLYRMQARSYVETKKLLLVR